MAVICIGQNAYGTEKQFAARFDFWMMKLEGRYEVSQILSALDSYTDENSDIPTPSDIIKILSPAKEEISKVDFLHAKEQQRLAGYPSHSYHAHLIRDYEAQQASKYTEEKRPELIESQKVIEIIQGAVNKF